MAVFLGREFIFSKHYQQDKDIDVELAKDCVDTGRKTPEKEERKFVSRKKYRRGELIVVYREFDQYVFVITAFWNQRKHKGDGNGF